MARKWSGATDKISFRADPAIRKKLEQMSDATGRTQSWLINFYLRIGLEQEHTAKLNHIPSINDLDDSSEAA